MRWLALIATAVLATACAPIRPTPPVRLYHCEAEIRSARGVMQADRLLGDVGQPVTVTVRWDAGSQFANPSITAFWIGPGGSDPTVATGRIDIMRHIWRKHFKASRLRLELTAEPEPSFAKAGPLIGRFEVSAGPFHLDVAWGDVTAVARKTPDLFLIARHQHGIVDRVRIDGGALLRAEPDFDEVLRETRRKTETFRQSCRYDSGEADVII